jgi:LPXTG-motif cell wall-anchored protein
VTFFAVWADASDIPKIPKTGGSALILGVALLFAGLASAVFVLLNKRSAAK